ncbi:MAG TPA: hypothetical protein VFR37_25410, partial [Longimicrobium sp.]|nr:hypothetical protein [Longimicrobium sp.]
MMPIVSSFDVLDGKRGSHTVAITIRGAPDRKAAQSPVAPDRKMEGVGIPPRAPQQRLPKPPPP